jgi:hypothetical protein
MRSSLVLFNDKPSVVPRLEQRHPTIGGGFKINRLGVINVIAITAEIMSRS